MPDEVNCGVGMYEENGRCVPDEVNCGAGMHEENGQCVPDENVVAECPVGMELVERQCVPNCPRGTTRERTGDCALPGYVVIPAGQFMMGSPDEEDPEDERPQHSVEITRAFWMKATPVTTGEWFDVMSTRPSHFTQMCGDDCPVEQVNWYEAVAYASKLSELEGLEPCYAQRECSGRLGEGFGPVYQCEEVTQLVRGCTGYRLPTEGEWEYAYRAGTTGAHYAEPVSHIAWLATNSNSQTHRVGQKQPNTWGLYDMAGNVWEWVWDQYSGDYYASSPGVDPQGPEANGMRVLRGGGWDSSAKTVRAANRYYNTPVQRRTYYGFRLVRMIPEPSP